MAQYIDIDKVVAEIKKIKSYIGSDRYLSDYEKGCNFGREDVCDSLLNFIDTLEVKEVDFDDFGFYWGEYVSNLGGDINNYEVAKYFYELGLNSQTKDKIEALRTEYEKGRADVIAKTLEWINVFNDNNYIMQYSDSCEHPINEIIEWYKNYINRE